MKLNENREVYGRFAGRELATLTNDELKHVMEIPRAPEKVKAKVYAHLMSRPGPAVRKYKTPPSPEAASNYSSVSWRPTLETPTTKREGDFVSRIEWSNRNGRYELCPWVYPRR
jgi:hypothetical protein